MHLGLDAPLAAANPDRVSPDQVELAGVIARFE